MEKFAPNFPPNRGSSLPSSPPRSPPLPPPWRRGKFCFKELNINLSKWRAKAYIAAHKTKHMKRLPAANGNHKSFVKKTSKSSISSFAVPPCSQPHLLPLLPLPPPPFGSCRPTSGRTRSTACTTSTSPASSSPAQGQ